MNDTRLELIEQIFDCTGCELSKSTTPVPFSGDTPARVAVLGLNPEEGEDLAFGSERGERLRTLLPEVATAWMNVVSCPGEVKSRHLAACSANCEAQLELADPEYVIIVGDDIILGAVRPKYLQGHTFRMDGKTFFPLVDPMTGDSSIIGQVERFRSLLDGADWMDFCGNDCATCGELAYYWDGESGIPSCESHAPKDRPRRKDLEPGVQPPRKKPKSCSMCGSRAKRFVSPYWDRERPICPECCRDTTNGNNRDGTWPEVPWG